MKCVYREPAVLCVTAMKIVTLDTSARRDSVLLDVLLTHNVARMRLVSTQSVRTHVCHPNVVNVQSAQCQIMKHFVPVPQLLLVTHSLDVCPSPMPAVDLLTATRVTLVRKVSAPRNVEKNLTVHVERHVLKAFADRSAMATSPVLKAICVTLVENVCQDVALTLIAVTKRCAIKANAVTLASLPQLDVPKQLNVGLPITDQSVFVPKDSKEIQKLNARKWNVEPIVNVSLQRLVLTTHVLTCVNFQMPVVQMLSAKSLVIRSSAHVQ